MTAEPGAGGMRLYRPPRILPKRAHPLVKRLYAEMARQQCTDRDMEERSGVNRNTLKDWRTRTVPTVDNLEACFCVLGYELTLRRKGDAAA